MHRRVLILYGSETGNAEDFAQTLAKNCRYRRYQPTVSAMDSFPPKGLLDYHVLIVVCSTAGQGEVPRNGRHFWRFLLRKKLPADLLSHIKFSTFGLGDSSYPRYNYAIRKMQARLLQLGAKEFSPRGECDEQSAEGPEAYYAAWEDHVFKNLPDCFDGAQVDPIDEDEVLPSLYHVEVESNKFKKRTDLEIGQIALQRQPGSDLSGSHLDRFQIATNERITAEDHFQDVRRLVLDATGGDDVDLKLQPGDTVGLYPSNDPGDVAELIKLQGWDDIADYPLKVTAADEAVHALSIPGGLVKKLTLRSLITHHLDIMSVPKRSFFVELYHFASDDREKDKLKEFTSLKEAQQLYDYANRPRRSILEVIQEFFSLHIPVEYILDVFPLIKPRLFSVSSAIDPHSIELTVAIVEYKTIIRRLRRGLCTHWIKSLKAGDNILAAVEHGKVRYGNDETAPILVACTGTGVAPVKCMVEKEIAKQPHRDIYVFTGDRYHDKDFLYGSFWQKLAKEGQVKLFASFSRDDDAKVSGVRYVQDRLYQQKTLVNEVLFKRNGVFYLCGSSGKMPIQVRITMETLLQEENGWSEQEAKKYLSSLEGSSRYIQDTW